MFEIEIKDQRISADGDIHCDRCGRYLDGSNGGIIVEYGLGLRYIAGYFLCDVCHSECQKEIDAFITKESVG